MKIRTGFVSNSSSSSFNVTMWGAHMTIKDFIATRILTAGALPNLDDDDDDYYAEEDAACTLSSNGHGIRVFAWDGDVWIGRELTACKDAQTMGDFKRETVEKVEQFLGRPAKCELIDDSFAGYEGGPGWLN